MNINKIYKNKLNDQYFYYPKQVFERETTTSMLLRH